MKNSEYYFCYSSSLDLESLDQWKMQHGYPTFELPRSSALKAGAQNSAHVFDFPSRFWGGRVLSLHANPNATVQGILFRIENASDWNVIAHKEGVMTGVSQELIVQVRASSGPVVEARTFVTHVSRRSSEGVVSDTFVRALERAYAQWGLDLAPVLAAAKQS